MRRPQKYFWLSCEPETPLDRLVQLYGAEGLGVYIHAILRLYQNQNGKIRLDFETRETMASECGIDISGWNDILRHAALLNLLDEDKLNEGVLELPELTPHVLRHR